MCWQGAAVHHSHTGNVVHLCAISEKCFYHNHSHTSDVVPVIIDKQAAMNMKHQGRDLPLLSQQN